MKTLLKLDQAIEAIRIWLRVLMFIMILIFGTIQVFGRFVLSFAPPWTEEVMRFCGIYLTFIRSTLTTRADAHVPVDILAGFLRSNKIRAGLLAVSRLICVMFLIALFPGVIILVQKSGNSLGAVIRVPYPYIYAAAPAGIIMMLCAYASAISKLTRQYAKGKEQVTTIAIITFLTFLVLSAPISFAIGPSGPLTIVMGSDVPSFMATQQAIHGMNSFSLMAGPLFILVDEILGAAKLSRRILDFCRACISQFRGGFGIVLVMVNMIFTGVSGSGAATMNAVSTLTVPELKRAGYDRAFTASMIASSGALAPVIPPSTNTIAYVLLTGFSVRELFMGGVIPGLLVGFAFTGMCYWYARKYNINAGTSTLDLHAAWKSFEDVSFALVILIIIIAGVVSGIFTAMGSGIITCLCTLICGLFTHHTLRLKDSLGIFRRATSSSIMLMMIIEIFNIYSYIFARENLADTIKTFMLFVSTNPIVVVLIITGIMLVIGCFMGTLATTAVILPIVYSLVVSLGADPLMFGMLFSIATVVGALMPSVGLYLFLSASTVEAPFKEVIRCAVPIVLIIPVVVVLTLIWPPSVTFVPHLLVGT